MMQVGVVRVLVVQGLVPMPMGVRLGRGLAGRLRVAMVLVVDVAVLVLQQLVDVLVLVPLGQMQPEAGGHQGARDQDTGRQRVAQEQDGQDRADEGRQREIGAGASGAEMAQGQDEQD
jgi:hypothetical protein